MVYGGELSRWLMRRPEVLLWCWKVGPPGVACAVAQFVGCPVKKFRRRRNAAIVARTVAHNNLAVKQLIQSLSNGSRPGHFRKKQSERTTAQWSNHTGRRLVRRNWRRAPSNGLAASTSRPTPSAWSRLPPRTSSGLPKDSPSLEPTAQPEPDAHTPLPTKKSCAGM